MGVCKVSDLYGDDTALSYNFKKERYIENEKIFWKNYYRVAQNESTGVKRVVKKYQLFGLSCHDKGTLIMLITDKKYIA